MRKKMVYILKHFFNFNNKYPKIEYKWLKINKTFKNQK
jgi:hypothetical protein